MKYLSLFFLSVLMMLAVNAKADTLTISTDSLAIIRKQINDSFKYQTGTINLKNGIATINVPQGFRYLDPEQSIRVLEEVWGNPPDSSSLGMLFPENLGPADPNGWAFNIRFSEEGYVKDDDAGEIDYDELLEQLKNDIKESNEARVRAGYEAVELMGWAAKPYYDKNKHTLHWAKEIKFGSGTENTLNYDVRVLGRRGVLVLQAISAMPQLKDVNQNIDKILNSVTFTEGNQYDDFDSSLDEVAAYGIGGLIAGKILTKAGLFATLGALLAKSGKLIIAGIVGLGGFLWRLLGGRKKEEETTTATNENHDADESQKS